MKKESFGSLFFWGGGCLEGVSGLAGACLDSFSAYEIERRPRGASRGKPAPTVYFGPVPPVRSPLCLLFVPFDIEVDAVAFHLTSVMHQGGQR
jgi:hypothetical protein